MERQLMANEPVSADAVLGREELWTIIRTRLRLMLAVVALLWGVVIIYTFTATPIYEATAGLSIQSSQPSGLSALAGMSPAAGLLGSVGSATQTHQWLILNPPVLQKAAAEVGLTTPLKDLPDLVRAEPVGDSLLVLSYQDPDPGRAADFVNKLAEIHEQAVEGQEKLRTQQVQNFLQKQLSGIKGNLSTSEEALRDYKRGRQIVDVVQQAQAGAQMLSALRGQAAAAGAEAASQRRTASYLRRRLATEAETYIASSTISRNPVIQDLEMRLTKLESDRAGETALRGPKHVAVQEMDSEISSVKKQLESAMEELVTSQVKSSNPLWIENANGLAVAEAGARAAEARQTAFDRTIDREWSKMRSLPDWQVDLGRLERETLIGSKAYADLIAQFYQTQVQSVNNERLVTLVAPAQKPDRPIRPRKIINLVLGLILACVAAAVSVVTAEALSDVFRSARDAQLYLGLPLLARVPHVRRLAGLLQAGALADAFRSLRTSLRFLSREKPAKVWLVTSSREADGTATVAANLAAAFAEHGDNTLLIDGNLRGASLHSVFSLANDGGVTDAIGGGNANKLVQTTARPHLHLLAAGPEVENPIELLENGRAGALLDALRPHYDTIIIAGGALILADALLWAAAADASILVISVGDTSRRAAGGAMEQLETVDRTPVGFVANRV